MPEFRVLILGGTTEANRLAGRLLKDPRFDIRTSLAGVTHNPKKLPGKVRKGGFGGMEGLRDYLLDRQVDAVIDATHPFATQISNHAGKACREARVPRVTLLRPPWRRTKADNWIDASDVADAVRLLPGQIDSKDGRVLLALGKKHVRAFRDAPKIRYVVRTVDPTISRVPFESAIFVQDRGPFTVENERALFKKNKIQAVVSRNSGGKSSYAKIQVARELGLPVVMIERPPRPTGKIVETLQDTVDWLNSVL